MKQKHSLDLSDDLQENFIAMCLYTFKYRIAF